jgi:hypothetical protein
MEIVARVLTSWPLLYGNSVVVVWHDDLLQLRSSTAAMRIQRPVQPVAVVYASGELESI